jgi:hypothetical protein
VSEQRIGECGAAIDELAAFFDQALESSHENGFGIPDAQVLRMVGRKSSSSSASRGSSLAPEGNRTCR